MTNLAQKIKDRIANLHVEITRIEQAAKADTAAAKSEIALLQKGQEALTPANEELLAQLQDLGLW